QIYLPETSQIDILPALMAKPVIHGQARNEAIDRGPAMTPDGSLLHSTDRLPDLLPPCDVLTPLNDLAGFRPYHVRDRWSFLIDFPPESEKGAGHYGHADGKYDPKAPHGESCSIPAHRLAPITAGAKFPPHSQAIIQSH